jgi:hypothetical protein
MLLVAVVVPLAVLAGLAMGIRIGDYGWTPERIWGAIAVAIAILYGLGGWWSIWRGRRDFDEVLRPLQTRLAIALCGLALFLALPILDFGAISARSQFARLHQSEIKPDRFDWAAMAFDFGPAGRQRLLELARSGPAQWRGPAVAALTAEERYGLAAQTQEAVSADEVQGRVRALTPGLAITEDIRRRIAQRNLCPREAECGLLRVDADRLMIVASHGEERRLTSSMIDLTLPLHPRVEVATAAPPAPAGVDLDSARIEIRPITRRQLHVDGKPLGEPFE